MNTDVGGVQQGQRPRRAGGVMKMRTILLPALAFAVVVAVGFGVKATTVASHSHYTLDQAQPGATEAHVVDGAGSCWQQFTPSHESLARIDLAIERVGAPGNLTITLRDAAQAVVWQTTVSELVIASSGWLTIPVQPVQGLQAGSVHYVQLTAESPPSRLSRYLWYGRPDSGYDRGVSSVEVQSPGYDFAFRTWATAARPDLIVTGIWETDGIICCELMNHGEGVARGGFHVALIIDDREVADVFIRQNLQPGQRIDVAFDDYQWLCTLPGDAVTVHADSRNSIIEADLDNNRLTRILECDISPLEIVSGPDVLDVTEHTATVVWQTNRAADSTVRWGSRPEEYEADLADTAPKTHHQITITGLAPSTVYHCMVMSADGLGRIISSRPQYFRTRALPHDDPPEILALSLERADTPLQLYRMVAQTSDHDQVHKVEFFLGGRLIGTDYGGTGKRMEFDAWLDPHSIGLTRGELFAPHDLKAVAHDVRGRVTELVVAGIDPHAEPPNGVLEIVSPHPDYTYFCEDVMIPASACLDIEVYAAEYEYSCLLVDSLVAPALMLPQGDEMHDNNDQGSGSGYPVPEWMPVFEPPTCRDVARAVQQIDLFIDLDLDGTAELVDTWVPPSETRTSYTYRWNLEGLDHGRYYIVIRARLSDDTLLYDTRHVEIATEGVSLEREVIPYGDFYQVSLTATNAGSDPINFDTIIDNLTSFQAIACDGPNYRVYPDYCVETQQCVVTIDFFTEDSVWRVPLGPGQSVTASYLAVPIKQVAYVDGFRIGADDVIVSYDGRVPYTEAPFSRPVNPYIPPYDLLDGMNGADYLIVTNPERLFAHAGSDSFAEARVNTLLSTMADLARWKNGVLGYLGVPSSIDVAFDSASHDDVRAQIHSWGAYMQGSDGTPEGYLENGYLLIVGEPHIVPSASKKMNGRKYLTGEAKPLVPCTDMYYASTAGSIFNPQLKVGRIVGYWIEELVTPLQASIGVHRELEGYSFDRSQALIFSGWPRSREGGSDYNNFAAQATAIRDILDATGTESFIVDTTQYATPEPAVESFFTNAPGSSTIHLAGHGNVSSCDDLSVMDLYHVVDPFASTRPFVYASSCTTGQYHGDAFSLAEGFLIKGAGAYLGSTNISYCCTNRWVAKDFYQRWTHGTSLGSVLRELKRSLGDYNWRHPKYGYYEDIWTAQYQLYGDPKYGRGAFSLVESQPTGELSSSSELPTTIQVHVPPYTVATEEEGDLVQIPGGFAALVPGNPIVPVYDIHVDYPNGSRVQDVRLLDRSDPMITTGLSIPDFQPVPSTSDDTVVSATPSGPGWWPELAYDWGIDENADGSSTLALRVYPFIYNADTTEARFYQDYIFDIDVAMSCVEIVSLATDRIVYAQDELVGIQLVLHNDHEKPAADVFIEAFVVDESSGEYVDSLLLQMLDDVSGSAYVDLQWDSVGIEPGRYSLVVELKDAAGNSLDRSLIGVTLGVHTAQVASVSATPQVFESGDPITLHVLVENTGSVDLTGNIVIRVLEANGVLVQEFRHACTNLAPQSTWTLDEVWHTPEDSTGDYEIVAAVHYNSTASDPIGIRVSTLSDGQDTPTPSGLMRLLDRVTGLEFWITVGAVLVVFIMLTLMLHRRRRP